jgi:uncharacterized protein (TIGR03435 family)
LANASGQTPTQSDQKAVFDVASLKAAPPPSGRITVDLGNVSHGRLTLTNVTLSECLRFAFNIYTDEQIAGPEWIKDHRVLFDIVAQASPDTPRDQVRQMAVSLLTERFGLVLHHESRTIRYLALVADKDGVKMHETQDGSPAVTEIVRPGRIVYQHVSPLTLAVLLSRFTDQPILDRSGLNGKYDVDLQWTPDSPSAIPPADAQNVDASPALSAATREQLGIRLEERKGPLDVVVVDHVERSPTAN